jgi:3-hydroxy-9,10-secoandrosta-1,3,5(10)-triene-9,17-dione monooxygenase reductase component
MVTPEYFRSVLGRYTTGVAVIAAMAGGRPHGLTVSSFVSVSLEPPLVAFCVADTSTTWRCIRHAGGFGISLLGAGQKETCHLFATKNADRFSQVAWSLTPGGQPMLDDSLAWLDCVPEAVHEAGDHELVLAQVTSLAATDDDDPLVVYRGRFTRLLDGWPTAAGSDHRDMSIPSPRTPHSRHGADVDADRARPRAR